MIKYIFTIALSFICLSQINAQNIQYLNNALNIYSDNINSADARYIGMGSSMGALGGNINAVQQNPAGIGVNIASDIQLTLGLNSHTNNTTFGDRFEIDNSYAEFSQIGAILVIPGKENDWKNFTLGFNYTRESLENEIGIGRNTNINFIDDSDPNNIQNFTFNGFSDRIDGYRQKIALSFATNYQDKIYLGANLNFHSSEFNNFISYLERNETELSTTIYNQQNTPYFESGNGFSFGLGAIAKLSHNLRLGAAFHSPVWYNQINERFISADDDGFFENFSDYDLTTASRFVGSAGLVVSKNLALNFDYTRHFHNGINLRPNGDFTEVNNFIDDNLQNSSEYRVGGEIRLNDLRLRAGYNFIETPFQDVLPREGRAFVDGANAFIGQANDGLGTNGERFVTQLGNNQISNAFTGDIQRYTAGIGYDFKDFYIDVAYQYQSQDFNYVFGDTDFTDVSNSQNFIVLDDPYVAQVEETRDLFLLTLGWRF